ncbi:MAG TPA: monovalent cation/H(+) antiporter subunit G [Gammaproteobacteria bacterium]|nr:monovalent cation/H(+) antiporter subunit G [Gammaproteobacteria bacterium]
MNLAAECLLAFAVLMAWIVTLAFLRLRTPFERLHAVTFFNIVTGGAVTAAVIASDGFTQRTFKCLLIWVAMVGASALLSHATARALHLRGGERL